MKALLLITILVLINSLSFAHLCHDPFRPREHLILVPEKDLIRIEEEGEFRIYVENTFHSILRDVRLFVENPALEIEVEPPVLRNLLPGERTFFLIKLKLKEGFVPGDYPLRISVGARSAELRPSIEKMVVGVEKKKVEHKIIEQERPPPPKKEPTPPQQEVIPTEEKLIEPPKEEKKTEVLPDERPVVPPPEKEVVKPKVEKPLEPLKEKTEVLPEERPVPPPEKEVIKPKGEKEEIKPQEEVVVRVEKIPFWKKPYFYIILISLLIAFLIWRKIKKR